MDIFEKIRQGAYTHSMPYTTKSVDPDAHAAYRLAEDRVLEEFWQDARQYALDNGVPSQYVEKVLYRAWSSGHSSGYMEVAIILDDLTEIFK